MSLDISGRILALRAAMQRLQLDAYIIPTGDPHQSEYVADHWKTREWLTGFTGSAGTLVVTSDHAGLWTDSRYFLQAENELTGSGIELHKQLIPHTPEHFSWLTTHLKPGNTVGMDGALFSTSQVRQMAKIFYEYDIEINHQHDLVSELWKDRPALPSDPAFEFDADYAGATRSEKLDHVKAAMSTDFLLVTTLDDIAWTLNLRGNDVAYNPVCISYLIIGKEVSYLFIDREKVSDLLRTRLGADGILLKPYETIEAFLQQLPEGKTIGVDATTTNIRLYNAIPEEQLVKHELVPRQLKAIKSGAEMKHLRTAMRKDAVALTRLFRWLEKVLTSGAEVTEAQVGRRLDGYRREQGDYFGESFGAIVGYNANGAIVHYRPDPNNSAVIRPEGILLLDSGGQYLQGTTDITRTIALSEPTAQQKQDFTLVLKGHIALAMAKFPAGTMGIQLDAFARQAMWQYGLNYGHGTGHGVGYFLCVHEPPQGFAAGIGRGATPIEPGMLTSNEPGLYRAGAYGIRTENLVWCVKDYSGDFGDFLKFETLSLFPIDQTLIDIALLTPAEKQWLNEYHAIVEEAVSPFLDKQEAAWLHKKCRPLPGK